MSMPSRRIFALHALWVACALAVGCSSEDDTVPTKPLPPPTLAITSLTAVGGPQWKVGDSPACVERGRDPSETVALSVALTDFILRPPGTCTTRACGTLEIALDPAGESEAQKWQGAQSTLELPFSGVADGSHGLRVALLRSDGSPALDAERQPVTAEVTFELAAPGACGGSTDAGSDAADAATDAADSGDAAGDANGDAEADAGDAGTQDAASDSSTDAPSDATND
ncbi:MAG: hypothetical protein R3B13_35645 [Polyangiaceae bacterium]